ncbi:hypothetical protein C3E77_14365 [Mycetocola zhujimingii]|nr:hypothetical protein C3E77_14365 [Mycetocola zhujimingii]
MIDRMNNPQSPSAAPVTEQDIGNLAPQLANYRSYWLGWGAESTRDDSVTWTRSGIAHPRLNAVLRVQDSDPESTLAAATEHFAGVPWLWELGDDTDPAIEKHLQERGIRQVGTTPVMALGLGRFALGDIPADLTIEPVSPNGDLGAWVDGYAASMGVSATARESAIEAEGLRPSDGSLERFIGIIDGRIVGTAELLVSDGVAGIYLVATDAAFRGRGIATALTGWALNVAQEKGLRVATLQASTLGQPVYERMGFTVISHLRSFKV